MHEVDMRLLPFFRELANRKFTISKTVALIGSADLFVRWSLRRENRAPFPGYQR